MLASAKFGVRSSLLIPLPPATTHSLGPSPACSYIWAARRPMAAPPNSKPGVPSDAFGLAPGSQN
ncbi:hypothetical protein C8Q70DRAFT_983146 [Cubamyces menziesii]|nr:hypothetical protein C8Q70DRAFT_983146 [Cubamyces menziesii]